MTPDLECDRLVKRFGQTLAVDDVSFDVPRGSFFSILGPSGCGKTTIMRMIAGFLDPTSGDIRIKGRSMTDVAPNKRPVNMVFQHLALFPMMNVADNIGYGLRRQKLGRAEIDRKVADALDRIGLPGIGTRKIDELSGGQKQRVAIARCMVLEPDVLLLDEPLGALDLKLREHMKIELKALQAAFDTTFVYITHDQSEALVMSDTIAVMNHGRFEQTGTGRDLYDRPATPFVAGFIGEANHWRGTVEDIRGDSLAIRTEAGVRLTASGHGRALAPGDAAEIFVRPEAVRVAEDATETARFENRLTGTIGSLLFNGAGSRILVHDAATGGEIDVALPQSADFAHIAKGATVHLGWDAAQANCFKARPSDDAL